MHKSGYRSIPKFWFLIVLGGAFAMAMGKLRKCNNLHSC